MDEKVARILNEATKAFYESQAESFSASRRRPWIGWRELDEPLAQLVAGQATTNKPVCVLDVACGNLRFEKYLLQEFPQANFEFYTVDATPALLDEHIATHHTQLDVVEALLTGRPGEIAAPGSVNFNTQEPVDLAVCFGFLHHIPGMELRARLLRQLVANTRAGGLVVCTFWCFGNNRQLAENARETTAKALPELGLNTAHLEPNDHLLGWQGKQGVYRFSHDFSSEEIDDLLATLQGSATLEARFAADGRGGNLNTYAVLRVNG